MILFPTIQGNDATRAQILPCWLFFFIILSNVSANVEKTIFLGPPATTVPDQHPNLDDLFLISLSPLHSTARTRLNASFPTADAPKGTEAWVLLDGLTPGARYEVRICWLATQPTGFDLYTHTLSKTFDTPELIASLSTYAYARQAELNDFQAQRLVGRRVYDQTTSEISRKSILFLQMFAAAEYFSLNKTLMSDVPPILVDVILDPYLFNVFPQSLVPTAGYLLVLAVGAWFLSSLIWKVLVQVADVGRTERLKMPDAAKKK